MKQKTETSDTKAESPYLAARREWNERYGEYIAAAHHWRLIALGSMVVALCAVGGLVAVAGQAEVVPYAVELSGAGEVVRVQRADVLAAPNANQIRAALRTWIIGARTVYSDPRALEAAVNQTYAETLPNSPAYERLAEYHRATNPYQRAGREAVTVEVNAVLPLSGETWQVEWTETVRDGSGRTLQTESWQATLTVTISPPTDAAQIMANPLGLYVRTFDWTRRI
jgi:type IV secretion system protein VirB5